MIAENVSAGQEHPAKHWQYGEKRREDCLAQFPSGYFPSTCEGVAVLTLHHNAVCNCHQRCPDIATKVDSMQVPLYACMENQSKAGKSDSW